MPEPSEPCQAGSHVDTRAVPQSGHKPGYGASFPLTVRLLSERRVKMEWRAVPVSGTWPGQPRVDSPASLL